MPFFFFFFAKCFIGKLTPSFQFLSINGGRLTVDCDVDGLDICVDVIDSCALVRPRSLPADRWDFQVLVIWCHVPYERSRTHKAEKKERKKISGDGPLGVEVQSQHSWPRRSFQARRCCCEARGRSSSTCAKPCYRGWWWCNSSTCEDVWSWGATRTAAENLFVVLTKNKKKQRWERRRGSEMRMKRLPERQEWRWSLSSLARQPHPARRREMFLRGG